MKKNILIVCSYDLSLIGFRGDFIKALIKEGYEVYTAAPELSEEVKHELQAYGAHPLSYELNRAGISPLKDLKSIRQLRQIMTDNKIDLVFPYTIKPVIYASMAANKINTSVISLITGLGFTFTGVSAKARTLQKVAEFLYKRSIRKNKLVIFQNKDDEALFRNRKILLKDQATAVVSGSGVNLGKYKYRVNEKDTDSIIFIFVARLIREKGVHHFVNAASVLKKEYPNAEFHVVGKTENSPSAIEEDDLLRLHEEGVIYYHGRVNTVPELLYKTDVFVLPTFYREGVPRSILEALSVGMPVITTDTPGCRETIVEGVNGFLIEPDNLESLISALRKILNDPTQIRAMGLKSRKMAEEVFDVDIINKNLIQHINQVVQ